MTCILVRVCVRNIPACLGRASVSWLRDKSAQSQTNQTIFQFIFHIYIKSTQNKQKTFQIWVFPCCTESPECCGRGKMKIWIPHQTQSSGLQGFHDKSNFVCLCPMHRFFSGKIALLILRNIWVFEKAQFISNQSSFKIYERAQVFS